MKLFAIVVAVLVLAGVGFYAVSNPGSFGSLFGAAGDCEKSKAPAGAIAWMDSKVELRRIGGSWQVVITQEDKLMESYTPHCTKGFQDGMTDAGGAQGTWFFFGTIKIIQNSDGSTRSEFKFDGITRSHDLLAGGVVIVEPPTAFFTEQSYFTTEVSGAIAWKDAAGSLGDSDPISGSLSGYAAGF